VSSIYIIAEAGVNHDGDRDKAFELVDIAVDAGADAVKFQTFRADNLVTKGAEKANYQKQSTSSVESQHEMLRRLELSKETHVDLMSYCKKNNIEFLSTAFDSESLNFLFNTVGVRKLKLASGEITNGPLLLEHARTGCDLILSTGMATLGEIEDALGVLAFGLLHSNDNEEKPSKTAFQKALYSEKGQKILRKKVTMLHCTTEYPAPPEEINLKAMQTMHSTFGLKVGYSDHSEGIVVPIAAAAMGAILIEKHITLDKELAGPDHAASLDPDELKAMVSAIRMVEVVKGCEYKKPQLSELNNRLVARKSLVASKPIAKGDKFTPGCIAIKRPGIGVNPMKYWDFIGKESRFEFEVDEIIAE